MAKRVVWLGIYSPAPDSIPRPRRVEEAFADESEARAWAEEFNQHMRGAFSSRRDVQRIEVKPKRRASASSREERSS